jgi:hypothetical protein
MIFRLPEEKWEEHIRAPPPLALELVASTVAIASVVIRAFATIVSVAAGKAG